MESDIKVKCTLDEMGELFDKNETFSVRHFKMIGNNLFQCTIRHRELEKRLSGTYTINRLKKIFGEQLSENETNNNIRNINIIDSELHQLRKELRQKIVKLLEKQPEKKIHLKTNDLDKPTYVYYSDDDGAAYEGEVTSVWIDEDGLNFKVQNIDYPVEVSEADSLFMFRSHEWLIGLIYNICQTLDIDPETI